MISLVFALAMAAAEPTAPSNTSPSTQQPAKSTKAKPDDMVCKREAVLGSRMKQRVCLTQAEWDARKADSRQELERSQSVKPLTF